MTLPAPVKQAHIARALREAKKAKAKSVRIAPDGEITIYLGGDGEPLVEGLEPEPPKPANPPPIKIRPKRKVRL